METRDALEYRARADPRHDRWDDPYMRTPYQSVGSVRTTFDPSTFGSGLLEACDGELDWKEGGN